MVCAIVLAAGRSRRMGTQKLVLPFAGSTVVARVVDAFLGAPVDTVVVVTGADDPQIRRALAGRRVIFVENPYLDGDMLSSVRSGLRAIPMDRPLTPSLPPSDGGRVSEGPVKGMRRTSGRRGVPIQSASAVAAVAGTVAVAPGDQPSLESGLIRRMLSAFRASGRGILVPVHEGRRGHPLVFAARFREELLTSHEGTGLRGLLRSHPAEVFDWPTPDAAVLEDLDTPEDYQQAVQQA